MPRDAAAHDPAEGAAHRGVACSLCGATAPSPPLTWSTSTGPRGTTWACDACTRTHLRSMEAKLDEEHW